MKSGVKVLVLVFLLGFIWQESKAQINKEGFRGPLVAASDVRLVLGLATEKELFRLIRQGEIYSLRSLLYRLAAEYGQAFVVKWLDKPTGKKTRSIRSTPLIAAVKAFNEAIKKIEQEPSIAQQAFVVARDAFLIVEELLLFGVDINKQTEVNRETENGRWSALHEAVRGRYLDVVWLLLSRKAFVNLRDHEGRTPLHIAASAGSLETVSLLLENGAEIDAQDEKDLTPLHCAAKFGNKEVVKLLTQHKASLFVVDCDGNTPRDFARVFDDRKHPGHQEVAKYLGDAIKGKRRHSV